MPIDTKQFYQDQKLRRTPLTPNFIISYLTNILTYNLECLFIKADRKTMQKDKRMIN